MEAHMHGNGATLPSRPHECESHENCMSYLSCDVILYGNGSSTSPNGRMTVPVGNLALTCSVATLRVETGSGCTQPIRERTTYSAPDLFVVASNSGRKSLLCTGCTRL